MSYDQWKTDSGYHEPTPEEERERVDTMTQYNADELWEELENALPRQQLIRRLYATEQHARIIQKDEEQPLTVLLRDVRQHLEEGQAETILKAIYEWQAGSEVLPTELWARLRGYFDKAGA